MPRETRLAKKGPTSFPGAATAAALAAAVSLLAAVPGAAPGPAVAAAADRKAAAAAPPSARDAGARDPAAKDPGSLAADLARLRGETEQLAAELEAAKEESRAALRALAAQQTDLELDLGREEVRLEQLRAKAAERRERVAREAAARDALRPAVVAAVTQLAAAVERGLPFHTTERTKQITDIAAQLNDGLLSPAEAVARLWDRVEDELRLTRESGLYEQVLPVGAGGAESLVDVARIGMVGLVYRAPDGGFGRAERTAEGWAFRPLVDEADRRRAAALFDAFQKQVRTGLFELPGEVLGAAAPAGGGS